MPVDRRRGVDRDAREARPVRGKRAQPAGAEAPVDVVVAGDRPRREAAPRWCGPRRRRRRRSRRSPRAAGRRAPAGRRACAAGRAGSRRDAGSRSRRSRRSAHRCPRRATRRRARTRRASPSSSPIARKPCTALQLDPPARLDPGDVLLVVDRHDARGAAVLGQVGVEPVERADVEHTLARRTTRAGTAPGSGGRAPPPGCRDRAAALSANV